ncbi:MAG: HemK/PrmC family methyltransferase [Patescibacteria group bacterium]|nr:HemK/PrmC family methyltransferase [Patescibacteria group bacterium]
MTISEAITKTSAKLQPDRISCAEEKHLGRLEAEILLSHALKRDRVWLLAHPTEKIPAADFRNFSRLFSRRLKHEPIAYILGKKEFFGYDFIVTPDVLIPRPETELMIETITSDFFSFLPAKESSAEEILDRGPVRDRLKRAPQARIRPAGSSPPLIVDIGTGSGAVAITLAKQFPQATVIATDASSDALRIARQNAKRLKADNVSFLKADLLNTKVLTRLRSVSKKSDSLIIAANLPYLPESDKKILDPDVVKFEPSQALFTGRDGLELIIRLLDQIAFNRHGLPFRRIAVYLEFDPPQAPKLKKLAKNLFPAAQMEIKKDLAKRNRLLSIKVNRQ